MERNGGTVYWNEDEGFYEVYTQSGRYYERPLGKSVGEVMWKINEIIAYIGACHYCDNPVVVSSEKSDKYIICPDCDPHGPVFSKEWYC